MAKRGKLGVPDRWEDYTNIGSVVSGTSFIPFKVPLNGHLLKFVDGKSSKWGLQELFDFVPQLGLVIDLTNTSRYYSPKIIEERGVKYCKIYTKGHEIPEESVVKRFYDAVETVEEDQVIGVHCTHGLNRTGYLICRFMIEKKGVDPEEAIQRFDKARGHKQERLNYLNHLRDKTWESVNNSHSEKNTLGSESSNLVNNEKKFKEREIVNRPEVLNYPSASHSGCNWNSQRKPYDSTTGYENRTRGRRTRYSNNLEEETSAASDYNEYNNIHESARKRRFDSHENKKSKKQHGSFIERRRRFENDHSSQSQRHDDRRRSTFRASNSIFMEEDTNYYRFRQDSDKNRNSSNTSNSQLNYHRERLDYGYSSHGNPGGDSFPRNGFRNSHTYFNYPTNNFQCSSKKSRHSSSQYGCNQGSSSSNSKRRKTMMRSTDRGK